MISRMWLPWMLLLLMSTWSVARLRRFLVARDYRVDDAEKLLKATTEWRREYRPASVQCSWCHDRPGFHCMVSPTVIALNV